MRNVLLIIVTSMESNMKEKAQDQHKHPTEHGMSERKLHEQKEEHQQIKLVTRLGLLYFQAGLRTPLVFEQIPFVQECFPAPRADHPLACRIAGGPIASKTGVRRDALDRQSVAQFYEHHH
jgi:hypothetical protein